MYSSRRIISRMNCPNILWDLGTLAWLQYIIKNLYEVGNWRSKSSKLSTFLSRHFTSYGSIIKGNEILQRSILLGCIMSSILVAIRSAVIPRSLRFTFCSIFWRALSIIFTVIWTVSWLRPSSWLWIDIIQSMSSALWKSSILNLLFWGLGLPPLPSCSSCSC